MRKAAKLHGYFDVFSYEWDEATGELRWLCMFKWEQPGDTRLADMLPRFAVRRFRCPLKAHRWAYLFALRLWREFGKSN